MFGVPNMFLFEKVPESVNHIMRFRFQDHVGTKLTDAKAIASVAQSDSVVADAVMKTVEAFAKVLQFGPKIEQVRGLINRVSDLIYVMDEQQLSTGGNHSQGSMAGHGDSGAASQSVDGIKFNSVDIVTPK